jgi:ribosome-associated heat shock protein Hsp15
MDKNQQPQQSLRIDKWLWFTRFYKTRALAGKAVAGGHVKLNGVRAKPSSNVSPGDVIDLVRDQLPFRLRAGVLPARRGPAAEARQSYFEDDASTARRQQILLSIRTDRMQMPRTAGKPDKHTRRKLRDRNRESG